MQKLMHVLNFRRKAKLVRINVTAEASAVPLGRRNNSADSKRGDLRTHALNKLDWIFKFLNSRMEYRGFGKVRQRRCS